MIGWKIMCLSTNYVLNIIASLQVFIDQTCSDFQNLTRLNFATATDLVDYIKPSTIYIIGRSYAVTCHWRAHEYKEMG